MIIHMHGILHRKHGSITDLCKVSSESVHNSRVTVSDG